MLTTRTEPDVPMAVELLESTAERLRVAAQRDGVPADAAVRLLRLADDLSSHALAARVLVTTGASPGALERVLQRTVALVDGHAADVALTH